MSTLLKTFILVISLLTLASLYLIKQRKKKYTNATYLARLKELTEFLSLIKSLGGYITWVERDNIKLTYAATGSFFKNKNKFYKQEPRISRFNEIYHSFEQHIKQHNLNYVKAEKERLKLYFDDIEGKSLDEQQRSALVTDEYSNLIIAGAGSGKTLTILAKVKYLIEQKNVSPEDILLLSFTNKTVEDLNKRIMALGLGTRAVTFHKLGYDIIKKFENNIPVITNENTLGKVIANYLKTDILNDRKALEAYVEYVACYMNIPEENDSYDSLGKKIDTEKGIDLQTLKSKCEPPNIVKTVKLDTIQGEKVKSVEELIIANFLYVNGIEYEYEKAYPHGTGVYRPDFYLTDYDIYLEHFGVDEHNEAKWLSSLNEAKYVEDMLLKRETHKKYHTKLLETYSYYNRDKILLSKLKEILTAENVLFKPLDSKDIYTKVSENDQNFGKEIIKLIEGFINLGKSRKMEEVNLKEIYSAKLSVKELFMAERQEMFLSFTLPILNKYNQILRERCEIDFNDMINRATDLIKNKQPKYSYKYIIIDEYQDISFSHFNLIKEIRDLSSARLTCVGDDWQSIYRFAGSDISLFSNFGKYVGYHEQLLIEQTFRNSQALIDVSANFVKKNPKQIAKNPISKKETVASPIKFVHHGRANIEVTFLNEVQNLVSRYGKTSILVLGRHSFDVIDLIKFSNGNIKFIERTGKLEVKGFEDVEINFLTVHKSKGAEADNVILLNLKNDWLGFPNKATDDPILSLLLSDDETYRFAEERRLFYVALTRTKNEVVLFIPDEASPFVDELLEDNNYLLAKNAKSFQSTNCPYCKTGKLMVKQNPLNNSRFLGCSHYPICNQTFKNLEILDKNLLCSSCESGFMVRRTGKHSAFLGCTQYPKCNNTIKLK
ncbi:UvrD-helicase domain-containing protein [Pedobacter sp. SL55]|uniref:UvrD-helicase domain-containing protein n=1 Tax=Pedobacter sp. SL55 TaxID=2995161 RepID=UPI00226F76D4|nr:UvrD-helicase domain-containing protein [Pedobacter sp. SL55]WAC40492.1 UvrD-helicase domain-containing protein [Pedobacter sp. SL55]